MIGDDASSTLAAGTLLSHLSRRRGAPPRIVVLRALPGLGDFLCAVPALRALRRALPKARIDLLGLASTRQLVERYSHYVDGMIDLPGFPGLPEQSPHVAAAPAFLAMMQSRRYDLALQLHGDGSITNVLACLLGATHVAGFYQPHQFCPNPETYLPYPQFAHEIERNLALLRFVGAVSDSTASELLLTPRDHKAFERLAQRHDLKPRQYVCIHAGAKDAARRWPADSFAECGRDLRRQGLRLVLTGTQEEQGANAELARRLGEPVTDLSAKTQLGALALLLRHARLVLCNDTGVSHLAAAVQTPSVVVFLNSDPARWAPLDHARHVAVGAGDGSPVSTSEVKAALHTLLQQQSSKTAHQGARRTALQACGFD